MRTATFFSNILRIYMQFFIIDALFYGFTKSKIARPIQCDDAVPPINFTNQRLSFCAADFLWNQYCLYVAPLFHIRKRSVDLFHFILRCKRKDFAQKLRMRFEESEIGPHITE